MTSWKARCPYLGLVEVVVDMVFLDVVLSQLRKAFKQASRDLMRDLNSLMDFDALWPRWSGSKQNSRTDILLQHTIERGNGKVRFGRWCADDAV